MMWEGREVTTSSKMGDKGMEDARGAPATAPRLITHEMCPCSLSLPSSALSKSKSRLLHSYLSTQGEVEQEANGTQQLTLRQRRAAKPAPM